MSNDSWVYVIVTDQYLPNCSVFMKIGMADSPYNRIKQIQTNNPTELQFLKIYNFSSREMALSIEKRLHEIFEDSNTVGEWFEYSATTKQELDKLECFLGENLLYIQGRNYKDYIYCDSYEKWDKYNTELEDA